MNSPLPRTVSVIVPCRNEKAHMAAFCEAVTHQRLPTGWQLQLLIADGLSDDGTRELLQGWVQRDPRLQLIDNPARIVSTGLNAAIAQAQGEVIVRMDVHTRYASDYIARCIETLEETGADNVGGPWRARVAGSGASDNATGQAIAVAFQSRWVAGGARSRDVRYNGWVDTVYLGAWPRATFTRWGGFDETLVRNQDDEHNLRITRGGGRIWQSAAIESVYEPRSSFKALFQQYLQYGYWKPFVMRKHGQAAALRHVVPGLFVGLLALSVVPAAYGNGGLLALLLALYGTAVLLASGLIVATHRPGLSWSVVWRLPVVIAAYHFGYGAGSLWGWFDVLRGRKTGGQGLNRLTR
jgi:glycosyltransferase involved in cell wall biosynthesis